MQLHENASDDFLIDPDPFVLAAVCLQGAAVILQLVQISQATPRSEKRRRAENQITMLSHLEKALQEYDSSIVWAEKIVRRSSGNPSKEFYEASFKVSLGVLSFSAKGVKEYHDAIAEVCSKVSALTGWIGHIISQDTQLAATIGDDVSQIVSDSAARLNALMADGGPIEAVLSEARLVRDALRSSVERRLSSDEN